MRFGWILCAMALGGCAVSGAAPPQEPAASQPSASSEPVASIGEQVNTVMLAAFNCGVLANQCQAVEREETCDTRMVTFVNEPDRKVTVRQWCSQSSCRSILPFDAHAGCLEPQPAEAGE